MKLIFIITDTNSAYIEYEHTGVMPQISCGKHVLESIESVNIHLTPPTHV